MSALLIKEAFEAASDRGVKVKWTELASKLWPEASYEARNVSMMHLRNGRTKRLSVEQVQAICDYLLCTPNELFGIL